MQRRVQIIISGIPVGVPISANGLSQCIENVYHVRGENKKSCCTHRPDTVWKAAGCHRAACPAFTQPLDTSPDVKLLVWTCAKVIRCLLMELLITHADTHLLSREPLPDLRRPADHCCLWSLTTVNSPTQPMRHASLPVCSQRACFPLCACVCLSEWVCVCTGPVLKGTDNRWWLQVIQTTANAERNCWLFIILSTADLQQLFTLFKGQGLFRATLYFPQHIRVRDTWFIEEKHSL